jgi:hypothetical protein
MNALKEDISMSMNEFEFSLKELEDLRLKAT